MNKIRGFKIRLRKREVLRYLKYDSRTTDIPPKIEDIIQDQIEDAYTLFEPAVVYDTFSLSSESSSMLAEKIMQGSEKIKEMIKRSSAVTCLAVTIGKKLEDHIENLKTTDITGAYVLDAIGSEAVEQAANFSTKLIKEEAAASNCYLMDRFSPGYSDWPLSASDTILNYLSADKIGISLSKDNIMDPRKSITAIQVWKTGRRK